MKRLSAIAVAVAMAVPPSAALADPAALETAFENTIVSTYPDGRTAKLWLQPGGTYRGEGRTGRRSSGQWRVNGEKICLRQSRPIPIPFAYCTHIRQGEVGASWTAKAVTGERIRVRVVAGR